MIFKYDAQAKSICYIEVESAALYRQPILSNKNSFFSFANDQQDLIDAKQSQIYQVDLLSDTELA